MKISINRPVSCCMSECILWLNHRLTVLEEYMSFRSYQDNIKLAKSVQFVMVDQKQHRVEASENLDEANCRQTTKLFYVHIILKSILYEIILSQALCANIF